MPNKFAVEVRIKDAHWDDFLKILNDRRTTVEDAHAWLKKRRYKISRGAVWNYRRSCTTHRMGNIGAAIAKLPPREARARLAAACKALLGE